MELKDIIIDNQNLIYKICSYFSKYENKEDLFQVGCIGLIKAYKNYNENMGAKFTTYAYPYILGEIKKYVREDKGLKISRDISKLNLKIEKATILLSQRLMREPSISEISLYLEIDEYLIVEALKSNNNIESIDKSINDDGKEMTLQDIIKVESLDIDSLIMLKEELNNLNSEEKTIINSRYNEDLTQSETAKNLGLTQVQVSRKEQKILMKLKDKLTI